MAALRRRSDDDGLAEMRERQAVTETKLDAVIAALAEQGRKLDHVIHGQQEGRDDRAELRRDIASLGAEVKLMVPDIRTVRLAKSFWKVAGWIGATAGSIAALVWAIWTWVLQHIPFR